MKNNITHIIIISFSVLLLGSCAGSYYEIRPSSLIHSANTLEDSIGFSYQYDVLAITHNRKLSKHENRSGINLLSVKITNYSSSAVTFGQDIALYSNNNPINILSPNVIFKLTKQSAAGHLFYLLLTPLKIFITSGTSVSVIPIGYALGPGLSLGNLLVATKANKALQEELIVMDIFNKMILPGQTVYGLIGFSQAAQIPLNIRFIDPSRRLASPLDMYKSLLYEDNIDQKIISNIQRNEADTSFESYIHRIEHLIQNNPHIVDFEVKKRYYNNGNLKYQGIQLVHSIEADPSFPYKVGTWEYYNKNGSLQEIIHYDLKQHVIKIYSY